VVSASEDGTLKLWDAETGQCLETVYQFRDGEYIWIRHDDHGRNTEIRSQSKGAWKHLDIRAIDKNTGHYILLPFTT